MKTSRVFAWLFAGIGVTLSPLGLAAQADLAEQVRQGRDLYARGCAQCHGPDLLGTDDGFALRGPTFMRVWEGERAGRLFDQVHERPDLDAGVLTSAERVALTVYIMDRNEVMASPGFALDVGLLTGVPLLVQTPAPAATPAEQPASTVAEPSTSESEPEPSASVSSEAPVPALWSGEVREYRPVTERTLEAAPGTDWLHPRGSSGNNGHSSLTAFTPEAVSQLRLAWSWAFDGRSSGGAVVRDGTVFTSSDGPDVVALDGVTGDLIWRAELGPAGVRVSSPSVYRDKLFLHLSNGETVAVRAVNGEIVWRTESVGSVHEQAPLPPIVGGGRVIVAAGSCGIEEECGVHAFDPATGAPVWAASLGDSEAVAVSGAYAEGLGATVWTVRDSDVGAAGAHRVIALSTGDGQALWSQEVVEAGGWMPSTVGSLVARDSLQSSFLTGGETGLLWDLPADGSQAGPFRQVLRENVFAEGGATPRADLAPGASPVSPLSLCPGLGGGVRGVNASAYGVAVTALATCSEVQLDDTGAHLKAFDLPGTGHRMGAVSLLQSEGGNPLWREDHLAPFTTDPVTTEGGLLFLGDADRGFQARDLANGEVVWSTRLPLVPIGSPFVFESGGRPFLAVMTGSPPRELRNLLGLLAPEIRFSDTGSGLFVFGLPGESGGS